jgi:hypothetical protein
MFPVAMAGASGTASFGSCAPQPKIRLFIVDSDVNIDKYVKDAARKESEAGIGGDPA